MNLLILCDKFKNKCAIFVIEKLDILFKYHWEVLMLVDSEVAAQVSGVAETVDYFG